MSTDSDRYACTLGPDAARQRLPQARALTERLIERRRHDDRLILRFRADRRTRTLVDEFVRDESRCCSFFDFAVERDAGEIVLELAAPAGAGHMLDAAMAAFDPDLDDRARLELHGRHAAGGGGAALDPSD